MTERKWDGRVHCIGVVAMLSCTREVRSIQSRTRVYWEAQFRIEHEQFPRGLVFNSTRLLHTPRMPDELALGAFYALRV